MNIQVYGRSEIGERNYNEDCIFYELVDDTEVIAMVADGLGGCGGGEIASGLVKEQFKQIKPKTVEGMELFFNKANEKVLEKQRRNLRMKSTAVAVSIKGQTLLSGHIGDSRLYHFYNGKLVYRTLDHSVTQLAVISGEISESQMRHHEDRNKLLRAIGTSSEIKPTIEERRLSEGMHVFLLCTDGFWEYVTEDNMLKKVNRKISAERWLDKLFSIWKRKAKNADNSSAVVIKCEVKEGD